MRNRFSVPACLIALFGLVAGGCGTVTVSTPRPTITPIAEPGVGLANPASVYCQEQGHTLEMRDDANGTYGVCIFADGSECEEWAFYRGECGPAGEQAPGVTYGGVSFSYHGAIAGSVSAETVPAVVSGDLPEWEVAPQHVLFSFEGYALAATFHEPRIAVYPVAEFEAASEAARISIAALRQLLADRPAAPDDIPLLPVFNAAQLMRAQVAYLDFENGTGVRFLTEYAQYYAPINNQDMFYAFQGLTADGSHVVSAILPVSHPSLPADASEIPGSDWDAFADGYTAYMDGVVQQLNAQDASSFTPGLALLDGMMRSISVAPASP